jgi:phage FluMu protein Com
MDEYVLGDIPSHLFTRKQLIAMGLKPVKGQISVAKVTWGSHRHKKVDYLFDIALAVPKVSSTPARLAAIERSQGTRAMARTKRNCRGCNKLMSRHAALHLSLCPRCHKIELRQTSRDTAICTTRDYFAQPEKFVFLNSEAANLGMHSEIIEVVVLSLQGDVLFDSLVRPQQSPLWRIHRAPRIIHQMVASAPTFPEIYPMLCEAIRDKIVIAYNMAAAQHRFNFVIAKHGLPDLPLRQWSCALSLYATFMGSPTTAWSHYRKRLPSATRRARSDGETMLGLLRTIANTPLSTEAADTEFPFPLLTPMDAMS